MYSESDLSNSLQALERERSQHLETLPHLNFAENSELKSQVIRLCVLSDYAFDIVQRPWFTLTWLSHPPKLSTVHRLLKQQLADCTNEGDAQQFIRQARHQVMVQIIFQRILQRSQYQHEVRWLSELADTLIQVALDWLEHFLAPNIGRAHNQQGEPMSMVVLAMGKQGAGELNLSSDIDLIFTFAESGDTQGGKRQLSHQEYFTRLGQKLIALLDAPTVEGRAFRVDMRLRPYGQSGPLVSSFAAMQEYYSSQGRDWERFAMIKARPVTALKQAEELMGLLQPFIFRQYVDYGAIDSLRNMKALINQEVRRRGLHDNIKLGAGGIREIEFIAQAFQLIRGGQDTELQTRSCLSVLHILAANGELPQQVVDDLVQAYRYLRWLEHSLQLLKDEQTQELVTAPFDQQRVSVLMGVESWAHLLTDLTRHRQKVAFHFAQLIAEEDSDDEQTARFDDIWLAKTTELMEQSIVAAFNDLQPPQQTLLAQQLWQLRQSRPVQQMQSIGRERLDQFMPLLLSQLHSSTVAGLTFERIRPLIEAIARRSVYLSMLNENHGALKHLVFLCEHSPWVSGELAKYPALLDELLNPDTLYSLPNKAELQADLRQKLLRVDPSDVEQQMFVLRQFIQTHKLQVAASELSNARPIMKVSDYLTYIAEVVVEQCLYLAWQQLVDRHGLPTNQQGEAHTEAQFIAIGYGKLGGIELSYESDLDMVFLHSGDKGSTNGARSIDNGTFYTRLGQRMIQLLTSPTASGSAYEVDMRLRPDGNSGLMVPTLTGFISYQDKDAWTWEHQALVRARVVAGNENLANQFFESRQQLLSKARDFEALKQDVASMRNKMRSHLGSKSKQAFHLKQDYGGIVDIEFLVQYAVLANAAQYPTLLGLTDNVGILQHLASQGLMPENMSNSLQQAYLTYRSIAHQRALQMQDLSLTTQQIEERGLHTCIEQVQRCWQDWLGEA